MKASTTPEGDHACSDAAPLTGYGKMRIWELGLSFPVEQCALEDWLSSSHCIEQTRQRQCSGVSLHGRESILERHVRCPWRLQFRLVGPRSVKSTCRSRDPDILPRWTMHIVRERAPHKVRFKDTRSSRTAEGRTRGGRPSQWRKEVRTTLIVRDRPNKLLETSKA
jgi:hypothetical protein